MSVEDVPQHAGRRGTVARLRRTLLLVAALALAPAMQVGGAPSVAPAAAADDCAGVTVRVEGPAGTSESCVSAGGDGLAVLDRAHDYAFVPGEPGMVCTIDGHPDPCNGAPADAYWSYWHAEAGATRWTYATRGAGNRTPAAGTHDAWVFGAGAPPSAPPPSAPPPSSQPEPSPSPSAPAPTPDDAGSGDGGSGDGGSADRGSGGRPGDGGGSSDGSDAAGSAGGDRSGDGGSGGDARTASGPTDGTSDDGGQVGDDGSSGSADGAAGSSEPAPDDGDDDGTDGTDGADADRADDDADAEPTTDDAAGDDGPATASTDEDDDASVAALDDTVTVDAPDGGRSGSGTASVVAALLVIGLGGAGVWRSRRGGTDPDAGA